MDTYGRFSTTHGSSARRTRAPRRRRPSTNCLSPWMSSAIAFLAFADEQKSERDERDPGHPDQGAPGDEREGPVREHHEHHPNTENQYRDSADDPAEHHASSRAKG